MQGNCERKVWTRKCKCSKMRKFQISRIHIGKILGSQVPVFCLQTDVSQQFPGHVAHDVELVVPNPANDLQQVDRHPVGRGRLQVHGPGPHRRGWHHLHVLVGDANQVSHPPINHEFVKYLIYAYAKGKCCFSIYSSFQSIEYLQKLM